MNSFTFGECVDFYLTYTNPENNTKQYVIPCPLKEEDEDKAKEEENEEDKDYKTVMLVDDVQKHWTCQKLTDNAYNNVMLVDNVETHWTLQKLTDIKTGKEYCALCYDDKLHRLFYLCHNEVDKIVAMQSKAAFRINPDNNIRLLHQCSGETLLVVYKTLQVELLETFVLK